MNPDGTRPQMGQQIPTQDQIEALSRFATLLKGLKPDYVPIIKSLEAINVDYKIMDVTIKDEKVECLVVPLQKLIYKEWSHMTTNQPVGEERVDE